MASFKYGVTRCYWFERRLVQKFGKRTTFTTRQAMKLYWQERKPEREQPEFVYDFDGNVKGRYTYENADTYWKDMNAKNYLAGAITAGIIERVERGVYRIVRKG